VWFDAHGESTTPETTTTGFLDGMPISTLLGRAWPALTKTIPGYAALPGNRIVLFGARDVEPAERILLESAGVLQPTNLQLFTEDLSRLAEQTEQVYIHVDLDVLDPTAATANQWASPNGLTLDDLLRAIAEIPKHSKAAALCIASYDPASDRDARALLAATKILEAVLRTES
jgi:arginase